jgi:TonB-linked SusC/RagA family outer membrane protein
MQVSASSFGQNVTLKQTNASLVSVFTEIRKQTGYDFFYSDRMMDNARPISVDLKNVPIEEALKQIFAKQPLVYELKDNAVMVKPKEPTFLERLADRWAAIDVRGRVVDQEGKPLPGATVKVKSTGKGFSTNGKGEFYLENVDQDAVLVISFIGYVSKSIKAEKELGDVVLDASDSKLDEVQVIAYGETTRRLSTGNVSTVKAEDIEKAPVANPLLAIVGRVPGINIQQSTGISSGPLNVTVQGLNSLRQNGNAPFYVIDGVPYSPNNLGTTVSGTILPGPESAFSFINPSDIESIDVLKDADATAIYGSRAANGAILITTKKGKSGKTKVDVNGQNGFGKVPKKLKLMNTEEYLQLRKEAYTNYSQPIPSIISSPNDIQYDVNGIWDQTKTEDWQKQLIGGNANYTTLNLSISGGNSNTQFVVGGGYIQETTVFPGDFKDRKANMRFNIIHQSSNQKLKVSLSGNYLQDRNSLPTVDLTSNSVTLAPDAPSLKNKDGSLNWGLIPNTNNYSYSSNPLSYTLQRYNATTNNVIGSGLISYTLIPGLELKSNFGFNRLETNERSITPQTAVSPGLSVNVRSSQFGIKSIETWICEPQLTYNKAALFGKIEGLLGFTFQQSNNEVFELLASGFTSDAQLGDLVSAPNQNILNSSMIKYRYDAFFGRLSYRYQDRYIFSFAARRDGSSRFGSANSFANFWSVAGAWIFTDKTFMKDKLPVLSFGKFRISYGVTGSDQISDYQYLSLYDSYPTDVPYQGTIGLVPRGLSNPYLQWEETKKLNLGLDLGFLDNRILFNGNYYINRSSNQLLGYSLPDVTGFSGVLTNLPALVQNTGIEIMLDAVLIKKNFFSWSSSINATANRNKLIRFDDIKSSSFASTNIIGKPINMIKVYPFSGVNTQTGMYDYRNVNGELTSTPNFSTDRTVILNVNPIWYGGWSNRFTYKGFQFDFLVSIIKQLRATDEYTFLTRPGVFNNNMPIDMNDRWKKNGDLAKYQKSGPTGGFSQSLFALGFSEARYSNNTIVRLKNATVSYSLPQKWIQRAGLQSLRVYSQGQNLLTFSNYWGLDPETQSIGILPPLRVFTLGVQLTL